MTTSSNQSFGSFHSSNVRERLHVPDDQYQAPPLPPVEFPQFTSKVEFGLEMKKKHFHLDQDWAFVNHGAFGSTVREVLEAQKSWQQYAESQPVRFSDREMFPQLIETITRVAKFIDCDKTDVVFVQNATTGTNSVIQSLVKTLNKGDEVLMTNFTYATVRHLLKQVGKERGLVINMVDIKFPVESNEQVVKLIEESITLKTKLAVLDHIPSTNALFLPIKEMIGVCHKRGVEVLVDGAHCFGSIPISMRDIGADYYVTNAHKWMCSCKGCAVLYVDKSHHDIIRPLLVSWGYGYGFNSEFAWTGLMDYTAYLSMNTVLDFWEFYGVEEIRSYIYATARRAGELLSAAWGTGLLASPDMFKQMVVVELPEGVVPGELDTAGSGHAHQRPSYEYKHAVAVQDALHYGYKVEVPVKVIEGRLYVRVSAHVYNTMEDYQRLADAINKMRKQK